MQYIIIKYLRYTDRQRMRDIEILRQKDRITQGQMNIDTEENWGIYIGTKGDRDKWI